MSSPTYRSEQSPLAPPPSPTRPPTSSPSNKGLEGRFIQRSRTQTQRPIPSRTSETRPSDRPSGLIAISFRNARARAFNPFPEIEPGCAHAGLTLDLYVGEARKSVYRPTLSSEGGGISSARAQSSPFRPSPPLFSRLIDRWGSSTPIRSERKIKSIEFRLIKSHPSCALSAASRACERSLFLAFDPSLLSFFPLTSPTDRVAILARKILAFRVAARLMIRAGKRKDRRLFSTLYFISDIEDIEDMSGFRLTESWLLHARQGNRL